MLLLLVTSLLAAEPDAGVNPRLSVSTLVCQTAVDCWMDADAKPIARPKKLQGKEFPRGECTSKKLLWLRNRVLCEENVCVVRHIGDKC